MAVINATGIQIQRYGNSGWADIFPKTAVSLLVKSTSDDTPFLSGGKINTTFLPDYLLGQMIYGGIASHESGTYINVAAITTNAQSKLGLTSSDTHISLIKFLGTTTTEITAGSTTATISVNSLSVTLLTNGSDDGTAVEYDGTKFVWTRATQNDDYAWVAASSLSYPAFSFQDCEGLYFLYQGEDNGSGYAELGLTDVRTGDWIIATAAGWKKIDNTDAVTSVAGKTGAVSLNIGDIGDGALTTALSEKAPIASPTFTGTITLPFSSAGFIKTNSSGVLSVDTNSYPTTANAMKTITLDSTNKILTFTAADGSTTLRTLTFASGATNGTIKITSNETNSPSFEVSVAGLGTMAFNNIANFVALNPQQGGVSHNGAYILGSANGTASWIDSANLQVVDNSINGLMTPAYKKSIDALRSTSTPSGTYTAGDICFVTLT